ncbi:hypothetical protein [Haliangium sp.]|uniref:hypothetical protein n=1 Tax=Haliangium sp. TaxID=2663208 RepID=UPI003D0B1471
MEIHGEQQIWDRLEARRHTAAVGFTPRAVPPSLHLLRVSCDAPLSTLGPVFEAQRQLEHLLGGPGALFDQARQRVLTGLRRRLLGDLPSAGLEGDLVDLGNRLERHSSRPYVLVFDALDAADDSSLAVLARVLQRRGWMQMPMLLVFRYGATSGAAARLIELMREVEGDDAVLTLATEPETDTGTLAASSWHSLPAEVVRVLRAGAVIGSGFEAELAAVLLGRPPLEVYDCLQRARDAGVPLEDRGDGRFSLHEDWVGELRGSLLPSLAAAWHRRLGMLLGGADFDEIVHTDELVRVLPHDGGDGGAVVSVGRDRGYAERSPGDLYAGDFYAGDHRTDDRSAGAPITGGYDAIVADADQTNEDSPRPPTPASSLAGVFDGPSDDTDPGGDSTEVGGAIEQAVAAARDWGDTAPVDVPSSSPRAPHGRGGDGRPGPGEAEAGAAVRPRSSRLRAASPPPHDHARAAGHLSAAGEVEAAAERYMIAAGQAAAAGAFGQAMDHVQRALSLIDGLPNTPERHEFRIRTLVTLGRLQWQAVNPSPDQDNAPFTLTSALETVDAALAALGPDGAATVVAEARSLAAAICYDLGDKEALERALDELTQASRLLLDAGDAIGAARLLNDQAAVYVRLGDPVRATHLLAKSQGIFESRAENDPVTMTELAETHHLLARLPLHARIRPGHEAEAVAMSLDHARTAEAWYRRLGAKRELARVWETMGRLELSRQAPERASEHLTRALQIQSSIADVTGLARTTAAMSEVLAMRGMLRNASMVLGDSIALNLDKGSPVGLAFNRRAYDALCRDLGSDAPPDVLAALDEVGSRLAQAETVLGRVELPEAHPD